MAKISDKLEAVFGYIFYGNIFMAISACVTLWLTYLQLDIPVKADDLTWFVFFATWFNYTFQRLLSIRNVPHNSLTTLMQWLLAHRSSQIFFLIISAAGMLFHLWFLWPHLYIPLIIVGILGLGYAFPLPIGNHKNIRLREVSILKIFLVAIVWALVTVALPVFYHHLPIFSAETSIIFAERLIFIFVLVLPFDLRDVLIDKLYHLQTIPMLVGKRKTILMGSLLIFLIVVLEGIRLSISGDAPIPYMTGFGVVSILTIITLYFSREKRHDFFYLGWIDGLPILKFLIIWVMLRLL